MKTYSSIECHINRIDCDYYYLVDLNALDENILKFTSAWTDLFDNISFAYSYKSNNLEFITKTMNKHGLFAEVVSLHEIELALQDGFYGSEIYFDGPVKMQSELEFAIKSGVNIQCDNLYELESIILTSRQLDIAPKVALRLSSVDENENISRFGMNKDEFSSALDMLKVANVPCSGVHIHVGSNLKSSCRLIKNLCYYEEEIRKVKETIQFIDIGGGYPASTCGEEPSKIIGEFAHNVRLKLLELDVDLQRTTLILEPGRSLTEDYAILVSSLVSCKQRQDENIITLSVPGTSVRSSKQHNNRDIIIHPIRDEDVEISLADIYGSNCYESDVIAFNVDIPMDLSLDDKLVVTSCGSYDIMNSSDWIRKKPRIYSVFNEELSVENYRPAT